MPDNRSLAQKLRAMSNDKGSPREAIIALRKLGRDDEADARERQLDAGLPIDYDEMAEADDVFTEGIHNRTFTFEGDMSDLMDMIFGRRDEDPFDNCPKCGDPAFLHTSLTGCIACHCTMYRA